MFPVAHVRTVAFQDFRSGRTNSFLLPQGAHLHTRHAFIGLIALRLRSAGGLNEAWLMLKKFKCEGARG